MVTVATELARALVADRDGDAYTLLCSRERPPSLQELDCEAVLAPYRHELALKLRWLPIIEGQLGGDAILYPYWPSPPMRRAGAPPAAVFVYDLAFKLRPAEVPWQQRAYMGSILAPSLRQAAAVLVISQKTRQDLLDCYPIQASIGSSRWCRWVSVARSRPGRCRPRLSPVSSSQSAPSSHARTTRAFWRPIGGSASAKAARHPS